MHALCSSRAGLVGFVALLGWGAARVEGQSANPTPRFPTNEDLRHTRALDDPQLSPDGRLVLATVTEPTVDGALERGWRTGDVIAVAGSLYLAGYVLAREGIL